jgi:hypothetical protein
MSLCDRCGIGIAATADDPVTITSLGRMHHACMREAWRDGRRAEATRKNEVRARRSQAAKAHYSKRLLKEVVP